MIFSFDRYFQANELELRKDWRKVKTLIKKEVQAGDFERSILLIEQASNLAYIYNFVRDYWDPEIDHYIQQVSLALTAQHEIGHVSSNPDKIVFFDHFVLENRGFAQQYLDVFINNGLEVLYVIDDERNYRPKNRIIETIERYQKGYISVLKAPSRVGKFYELLGIIKEFNPRKVFFHTAPWEIISCCVAYALQGKSTNKCYLLNITDHAFWPGITCFEFIVDWRSVGFNINRKLKGKEEKKLFVIPTPSYLDETIAFQGFPDIPSGKIIGFSGGSFYKILDRQNTFLNLVKEVIHQNEDFVFIFAAVGGRAKVEEFVRENRLESRFFVIGDRRDIGQIFKRIDIFFNTYPFSGGLMMKYSIACNKPILSFAHPKLLNSRLDVVLDCALSEEHLIFEKGKYLEVAAKLINDPLYRACYSKYYRQLSAESDRFNERVTQLLNDRPVDAVIRCEFSIHQHEITDFHIETERIQGKFYVPFIYSILKYKPMIFRLPISIKYMLFKIYRKIFAVTTNVLWVSVYLSY